MKGAGDAPTPDPQIGAAALKQAETGQQWLSFAKDAFKVTTARQAELDVTTKKIQDQQVGLASDQLKNSRADRARYDTQFKPIEDKFIKDASTYGDAAHQKAAAAEAGADVQSAAAQARGTAERNAAGLGITPGSGRWAGIERSGELGTGLAVANAENVARKQQRDKGLALQADVVNLGRGLPAQSAQAAALGLSAGSNAAGLGTNNQQVYLAGLQPVGQGFQGQMAGYQGQANTLNQQYSTESANWRQASANDAAGMSGIGSALGGIAGIIAASSEDVKHDKEKIPEGKALDQIENMPVEQWTYNEGIGDGGRHVGPYAEDFQQQTGKGDGKSINQMDLLGTTVKAVQDLAGKVDRISEQVAGLGQKAGATPRKKKLPIDDQEGPADDVPGDEAEPAGGRHQPSPPVKQRQEQMAAAHGPAADKFLPAGLGA